MDEALQTAEQYNVAITEEVANKLTPPLPQGNDAQKTQERKQILLRIAKICKRQGDFVLAAKKMTQAGEKMRGMKYILKSGDADKVINFAKNAR